MNDCWPLGALAGPLDRQTTIRVKIRSWGKARDFRGPRSEKNDDTAMSGLVPLWYGLFGQGSHPSSPLHPARVGGGGCVTESLGGREGTVKFHGKDTGFPQGTLASSPSSLSPSSSSPSPSSSSGLQGPCAGDVGSR